MKNHPPLELALHVSSFMPLTRMNIYCYISMIKMSIKNHGVRREEILCKDMPVSNGTLEWHSVWMVEPSDKSAMENECSAGGTYLVEKRLLDVYRKRT